AYSTDGEWIAHPTYEESDEATFEIVVAGRQLDDGDVAVMMVEAGGTEKSFQYYDEGAPKVDEAALATALQECKQYIKAAIALQQELVDAVGAKPTMSFDVQVDYTDDIYAQVESLGGERMNEIMQIADKSERGAAEDALRTEMVDRIVPELVTAAVAEGADEATAQAQATKQVKSAVRSLSKNTVRTR